MTTPATVADGSGLRKLILCLGATPTVQRTMLFEAITPGEANRATGVHEYASGKPVNVARVLQTLGHDALYLGLVGGDRGRFLCRDMDAAGIAYDVVETPVETRLCITVVNAFRRQATELIEESRPVPPEAGEQLLERLAAHLPRAAVVVMSGSLVGGLEDDFYARATRLARAAGVKVLLDTRGEPLRRALAERPDMVKPNRGELAATVGRPVESRNAMREAMQTMCRQGAGHVVVTRGRDGSSVSDGERVWEVSTPPVEAISPIGSGDAFAAGLALGMRESVELPEACRYAASCGAANAETPHAGHLDPDRVAGLIPQVMIRDLA